MLNDKIKKLIKEKKRAANMKVEKKWRSEIEKRKNNYHK